MRLEGVEKSEGIIVATSLLGALALVLLVRPVISVCSLFSRNYNEGWNAYHALRAVGAGPLYPDPATMIVNNYPPFSFYLVGGAGHLIGDMLIAGRLISLASFVFIVINVFWIVRRLGGSATAAYFGGAIFAATLLSYSPAYVGSDDPQLLGDAAMLAGLNLLLRRHDTFFSLFMASVVMIAAGLVKHSQIAIPIAVTVWLALSEREKLARWLVCGTLLLTAALSTMYVIYGHEIFDSIFEYRHYSLEGLVRAMADWLAPLLPLLGAALIFAATRWQDRKQNLIIVYLAFAAIEGLAVFEGVNVNILFDLIIALSIAAGLTIETIADGIKACGVTARQSQALSVLLLSLGVVVTSPLRLGGLVEYIVHRQAQENALREQISFIATHPGPAICEDLTLCYRAGKDFELDPFNAHLRFERIPGSEEPLLERLRAREFAVVQLTSWSASRGDDKFSQNFMQALLNNYRLVMNTDRPSSGIFVPLSEGD